MCKRIKTALYKAPLLEHGSEAVPRQRKGSRTQSTTAHKKWQRRHRYLRPTPSYTHRWYNHLFISIGQLRHRRATTDGLYSTDGITPYLYTTSSLDSKDGITKRLYAMPPWTDADDKDGVIRRSRLFCPTHGVSRPCRFAKLVRPTDSPIKTPRRSVV